MAGRHYKAVTPTIALSSGTAAYPLQITTTASCPVHIKAVGCSFDGTSATAQQILVELVKITTTAGGSAITERALDSDNSRSANVTAVYTTTAGSMVDNYAIHREYVHIQGKREFNPGVLTTGAEVWAVKVTPGTTGCNGQFWIIWEE